MPCLKRFLDRYPDIEVDLAMCDRTIELLEESIDLAIRIGTSPMWAFGDGIANKSLRIILAAYEPTPLPIHTVYRRSRFQPAKIQCFIDFLRDEFTLGLS